MNRVVQWARRLGFALPRVWVAELQTRGAVHYHVLAWLPKGRTLPKSDKRGWWPHGMTRTEAARCAVGYLAKYASKGQDAGTFPPGLRLHGHGGLEESRRPLYSWARMPGWVRALLAADRFPKRAAGGGVVTLDGEWFDSPWRVYFRGGDVFVCRAWEYVDGHRAGVVVGPWSTWPRT
jgi:hypothetical protein